VAGKSLCADREQPVNDHRRRTVPSQS
jgi:hypothetical protein